MDLSIGFKTKTLQHIQKYSKTSWLESLFQIGGTFVFLTILFFLKVYLQTSGFIICGVIFMALTYMRIFFIMHDMDHNVFFPNKYLNKIMGMLLGIIVKISFHNWSIEHYEHHESVNNLKFNVQQTGSIDINEIKGTFKGFIHKLVYNKFVFFSIVPMLYVFGYQRIVAKWYENILIGGYLFLIYHMGGYYLLMCDMVATYLMTVFLLMVLHSQHSFKGAYRKKKEDGWSKFEAAYFGSSVIMVPFPLSLFTYNIQYHSIHHLYSKVPGYNLNRCYVDGVEWFRFMNVLTLGDVYRNLGRMEYDYRKDMFLESL